MTYSTSARSLARTRVWVSDGVGYDGVGYDGVGYDGVGYDGVGYDGVCSGFAGAGAGESGWAAAVRPSGLYGRP